MRNNTKLKKLLKCADVTMSIEGRGMSWMIFEKDSKISFVVTGSSISAIVDEALRLVYEVNKKGRGFMKVL